LYQNLVYNKNLSHKIGSWCWRPGFSDLSQICINLPPLQHHPQINPNMRLSNLLQSKLEDFLHL